MPDPEVKINVRTTEAGGTSALGKVKSELGQLLGSIPGVSAGLGAVATAAGAIGLAMAGAAKAIHEFAQAEQGIAKLDAALSNFGQLNEANREKLQGLAADLQKATAIADDQWIDVLTKLVQFGSKPETIGMDVEAVKNLAGVVGDVGTATNLYTRALQGNFEMLGRYGLKVKDLDELQRVAAERGGGLLESRAHTMAGQFAALKNSVADAFEAIGQGIAKTGLLQVALLAASGVASSFAERFGTAYDSLTSFNRETAGAAEALATYKAQAQQVLDLTARHIEQLREEGKLLGEKQQILDQLTDKRAAMAIAQIDLEAATGRISPQQAIASKAGIRFQAAKEKIEREKATQQEQLRLNEDAVAALEERKTAVDSDLAKERRRLGPEERKAKIAALIASAADSRAEYGQEARWTTYLQFKGPNSKTTATEDLDAELARMQAWGARMASRVEGSVSLRRGRIAELEGMSSSLGDQISAARPSLERQRVFARASGVGSDLDLATASIEQAKAIAGPANRALAGAAAGVTGALQENAALSANLLKQVADIRREISQLHAQAKNAANK